MYNTCENLTLLLALHIGISISLKAVIVILTKLNDYTGNIIHIYLFIFVSYD